jgi:hypothetical protein
MKRQQITEGAFLEIPLLNGKFGYGRIIKHGYVAIYEIVSNTQVHDINYLSKLPVWFKVSVYGDVITQGYWHKIGKLPLEDSLRTLPFSYIQDRLHPNRFELYNPYTGEITKATQEECQGLAVCSVSDRNDVVLRILDRYYKRPNWHLTLDKFQFKYQSDMPKDFPLLERLPPTDEDYNRLRVFIEKYDLGDPTTLN